MNAAQVEAHIDKSGECWRFTGGHFYRKGRVQSYGAILWNGRVTGAHRVLWELTNGPVSDGLHVLHHCDHQWCVNPTHLYLGTHASNTRDAVARRRMTYGTAMWNHKLSDDDVRRIRALTETGMPTERIGPLFGVSGRTVRLIRSGKRWAHVT